MHIAPRLLPPSSDYGEVAGTQVGEGWPRRSGRPSLVLEVVMDQAIGIIGQALLLVTGLALVVSVIYFVLVVIRKIVRELKRLSIIE